MSLADPQIALPDAKPAALAGRPVPASPLLDVRSLSVGFAKKGKVTTIVEDVTLTIGRGECVGVVGESGSGKTLSFMAAMGLLGKSAVIGGSVRLDGKEILGLGERAMEAIRGRRIGMIFQDPQSALNPVRSIGAQLCEIVRLHHGLSTKAAEERAVDLLAMVGIPGPRLRLGNYPHELSGGMCQRAMIAVALASEPDLLIADEPTTALDATVQLQVLELLRDIQSRTGMGLVMITHDLGVVAEICDRVNIMYAGRIVESQSADALFDAPRHPYTDALIGCLPSFDHGRIAPMSIAGDVPMAGKYPQGCAFHPRCRQANDLCRLEKPEPEKLGAAASVACHKPLEDLRRVTV